MQTSFNLALTYFIYLAAIWIGAAWVVRTTPQRRSGLAVGIAFYIIFNIIAHIVFGGAPLVQTIRTLWFSNWWLAFLITAVYAAPLAGLYLVPTRLPRHFCQCGYDLTGNQSGVCPECGRVRKKRDRNHGDEDVAR